MHNLHCLAFLVDLVALTANHPLCFSITSLEAIEIFKSHFPVDTTKHLTSISLLKE